MISFNRKYIAIGGTFACAMAIAFVMQLGTELPPVPDQSAKAETKPVTLSRTKIVVSEIGPAQTGAKPETKPETPVKAVAEASAAPSVPAAAADAQAGGQKSGATTLTGITMTAAAPVASVPRVLPELPKPQRVSLKDSQPLHGAPRDPETPQLGCAVIAQATETMAATALLTVAAPCYPNERVTVHHNGMMFTQTTDDTGNLSVDVPVLAKHAIFVLAFANGKGAVAQATVPSVDQYDRIALQWSGASGFQIHAREFGAGYGEPGHVWSGSGRTEADADNGSGGFVTRLGDADTLSPQLVEVYTFPSGHAARSGSVKMSVEAEVTQANCERDVSAQVLEMHTGERLRTRDLVLSVPGCDAVGDFLVLNNLVDDLKIAGK